MTPLKTFGEIVKKFRKEKKLPLREVAKGVSIDTSTLGKIEKNERRPSKGLVKRFSTYFGVSEKDLMIASMSDIVAYKLIDGDYANEILKAAEEKVKYIKNSKKL